MESADYEESIAMRYRGLLSPEQIHLLQLIKRDHRAQKHSDWILHLTDERLTELQIESGVLPAS